MLSAAAYGPWAAAAVTLILAILFAFGRRRFRTIPILKPTVPASGAPAPDCMVIIPARDEQDSIARAVSTLPPDTVIVVDDFSSDRTAEAAREAGAGVLNAPPLSKNAIGKANACAFGAWALTSKWVLFTDADTWFEPGFLNAAVAGAESSELSMLSIYLDPEYRGFAENLLIPYAQALVFAGSAMAGRGQTLFRSQCLLVRRESYAFLGGHKAVMTQIAEDVRLVRLAERHRLTLGIARAPGLGHIRLYQGYAGIRSGIQRHAYRFMSLHAAIGTTVILTAMLAAAWLPILVWLLWEQQWIAAAVFFFVPASLLWPWYRRKAYAFIAPFAFYGLLPSLAGGLLSAFYNRPIRWKGRSIRSVP